jgi:hypothetical protein
MEHSTRKPGSEKETPDIRAASKVPKDAGASRNAFCVQYAIAATQCHSMARLSFIASPFSRSSAVSFHHMNQPTFTFSRNARFPESGETHTSRLPQPNGHGQEGQSGAPILSVESAVAAIAVSNNASDPLCRSSKRPSSLHWRRATAIERGRAWPRLARTREHALIGLAPSRRAEGHFLRCLRTQTWRRGTSSGSQSHTWRQSKQCRRMTCVVRVSLMTCVSKDLQPGHGAGALAPVHPRSWPVTANHDGGQRTFCLGTEPEVLSAVTPWGSIARVGRFL